MIEAGAFVAFDPGARRRALRGVAAGAPHAGRLVRPERGAHGAGRPQHRPHAAARRPGHRDGAVRSSRRAGGSTSSSRAGRSDEPPRTRKGARPRSGDVATNRQARFKYHLLETWETGIALQGSEVKSLRDGKVNLKDSYALVRDGEVWLHNCHIAPYEPAAREGHDPERPRKLLMHTQGDRAPDRQDAGEGPHAGPDADVLLGPAREGGAGAGARARSSATSARRSASATSAATWSGS